MSIAVAAGNNARSMTVRGQEILAPRGIPLQAPWANRIDQDAYCANGKKYLLNPGLGNIRRDANGLPIHGLVAEASAWKAIRRDSSVATSRLELWRFPDWMAQFPFAHSSR